MYFVPIIGKRTSNDEVLEKRTGSNLGDSKSSLLQSWMAVEVSRISA